MNLIQAARIARRELRGGLSGFYVFLTCLALGVAAIAAVGLTRESIERGLDREGAALLGGDAMLEFTYRFAQADERAWMEETASAVSEVVDFRSMLVAAGDGDRAERALTQVKAVDGAYPLVGRTRLSPPMPLAEALAPQGPLPGIVLHPILKDRLGLSLGDPVRLGSQEFTVTATLEFEPDGGAAGFGLGPRSIVATAALEGSGLLATGTLFSTEYRLALPDGRELAQVQAEAEARFSESGMRWRDRRNGAPGIQRFVERIGAFLVLVGLAGLAVGGVGVSSAVRAYLDRKTETIAILKTTGAAGRTIFASYLIQIGALAVAGIALGLAIGAALPLAIAPVVQARLPVPIAMAPYPGPLAEAAVYGLLTALVFTLWPLARTRDIRPAALFRAARGRVHAWPPLWALSAIAGLTAVLIATAAWFSGVPRLAYWTAGAILAALVALLAVAWILGRVARWGAGRRALRGRPGIRAALAAIGGPRAEAGPVVLSLGLGLSVLATVGQIDANLQSAIADDLPAEAPSYFFVDIQPDQIGPILDRLGQDPQVTRTDSAPMLRGVITRINDQPAREVAGDHWVLRGDRGVTYSAQLPDRDDLVSGAWWPDEYSGPPLVSFADEEAREIGLGLGDRVTVNILGRDITARVASTRAVDFSNAGMGFIMTMNPAALSAAPHSFILTVYAMPEAEARLLRDLSRDYPNITAIRVREAIDNVSRVMAGLAAAVRYGAAATLLTGFAVLIGAAAAGEQARVYEAAVLKTLGATRRRILASFALRAALMGGAAGLVALAAGSLAGWAVMTQVMEADFTLDLASAVTIVAGGILATLAAGMAFAWRPLATRPANILRARE